MTLQENSRKKRKKGLWLQGLKWTENSRQGSWSTDNIGSSYDPGSFPQEGQHTNILLSSELEIAEEEICRWDFPSPKFFFFCPIKSSSPLSLTGLCSDRETFALHCSSKRQSAPEKDQLPSFYFHVPAINTDLSQWTLTSVLSPRQLW